MREMERLYEATQQENTELKEDVLFYEKIGTEEENCTNLKKTIERIKEKPIFLKIDIEYKIHF